MFAIESAASNHPGTKFDRIGKVKTMKKSVLKKMMSALLAATMLLGVTLTGCSPSASAPTPAPASKDTPAPRETTGAPAEGASGGTLVLYASTPEDFLQVVTERFEAQTGIKVEVVSAGTGELYKRIEAEGENPLGDVMLGGMVSSGYVPNSQLWEPYVSSNDADLPAEFRNTTGNVTGFSLVPSALMLNNEVLGDIKVEGYADLLDPALKGKLVMPDPISTSSGWEQLVNILYAMGGGDTDEGWAYLDKLLANLDGKVLQSSGAVHKGVAEGEYAVGLIAEAMADPYIQQGMDVSKVFMSEGVVVNLDGVAIIKGAKNMDSAKKFIDFLTSQEFQQAMASIDLPRRPVRSDITIPADNGLTPTEDINQLTVDYDYIAEHKADMQEHFKTLAMKYAS